MHYYQSHSTFICGKLCISLSRNTDKVKKMDITVLLEQFWPITLKEMEGIRLMNRIDTKYVVAVPTLHAILQEAAIQYYVQEIDGARLADYRTTYLDTVDYRMFSMHEHGHAVREKIRVRTYVASGLNFLEIKNKNNKGRTEKRRISVAGPEAVFQPSGRAFLEQNAWFAPAALHYSLENRFCRITLVNYAKTERLTIDLGISFHNLDTDRSTDLAPLAIIEVKRDGRAHSPIIDILRRHHVVPCGFSKYCIGMALTDGSLPRNRIKPRLREITKMCREQIDGCLIL